MQSNVEHNLPVVLVHGLGIGKTMDGQYAYVTINVTDEDDMPVGYAIAFPPAMARSIGRALIKQAADVCKESRRSGYSDN